MNNTNFFITRRIGSTLYRVKIYPAENGTETMENKLFRIILNHPLANDRNCDIIGMSQMSCSA